MSGYEKSRRPEADLEQRSSVDGRETRRKRERERENEHDDGSAAREVALWSQIDARARTTPEDASSTAEEHADRMAEQVTGHAAPALFIVDGGPVMPGQMLKSAFLEKLKQLVTATANEELGPARAAVGCPYIALYFSRYGALPASSTETVIRRWAPAAQSARSADDLIPLVLTRVREGVRVWKATGQAPSELAAEAPSLAPQISSQRRGPGEAKAHRMTLDSLEADLGAGKALDRGGAQRMSAALGADVSAARIHEGPVAREKAAERDATAFAVGQNVVLGANAPRPGSLAGDALLAHELAHTAQQREAAADPLARHEPIADEQQAAERDADQRAEGALAGDRLAKLGGFAGAIGDVVRTGLSLQRCAANGAEGIDRASYYKKYEAQIAAGAANHLRELPFGTQDPSIAWTAGGAQLFARRLADSIAAPPTSDDLDSLVRPEQMSHLIDESRLMNEEGTTHGPDQYFGAVGIEVGNALARRAAESLARELPRYAQARLASGSEPKPDELPVSHPIDPLVAGALAPSPIVAIDRARFQALHPDLAGAPSKQTASRTIEWDPVGQTGMWRRLKEPLDATVEELAQAWLGSSTEAFRIQNAHPLYGIDADQRGAELAESVDQTAAGALLAEGGDVADEAMLAQAGPGKPTRPAVRILEQMRLNKNLLQTTVREHAQRFGLGGRVDAAAQRVGQRIQRLEGKDAAVLTWDAQTAEQADVIAKAARGLQNDLTRLELYASQYDDNLHEDPGAFKLPIEHRKALREDAEMWIDVLAISDLPTSALARLQQAAQHSATLDIAILENNLGAPQAAAYQSKDQAEVKTDFDTQSMTPRELETRKQLGQMRAQILADPTRLDAREAQNTSEQTRDLVFEAQVIQQATALDQAWNALDNLDGVLSHVTGDHGDLSALKSEGKRYYARWKAISDQIKTGKKTDARQAFEKLCNEPSFQDYLKRVNDLLKTVHKHHLIATLIAMVVITVVSMGAGAVINGLVGGAAVTVGAGAEATTIVTGGLAMGRIAGAVAGFIAETATFSALAHLTFTKDRTVGGFVGELARNIVLFGAMRGIAAGFRAAGLEKVAEAGLKADATSGAMVAAGGVRVGELVLNGGVGVLEAIIEAKVREAMGGKGMTQDELTELVKQTVIQTVVMALVARVAESPIHKLKVSAAFQGAKWRFAARGLANELRAVEALSSGKPTAEQVLAAAQHDQSQIQHELAALEELRTAADSDPKALEGTGLTKEQLTHQMDTLHAYQAKSHALELSFGMTEVAPDHYTAPRARIAEILKTHADLSKQPPKLESTDPQTGARTWIIFPREQGGTAFRITEQMPDWAITASGKRVAEAASRSGIDDHVVFNLPQPAIAGLLKADNALVHNDIAGAHDALEHAGLEPTLRSAFDAALTTAHPIPKGRKPLRNEDGSYYEGPTVPVDELWVSQDYVSEATSEGLPVEQLGQTMAEKGWQGGPLDVAKMPPDGHLLSVDNRRIVAAREANKIQTAKGEAPALPEVPVRVHEANEPFPPRDMPRNRFLSFILRSNIRQTSDGRLYTGAGKDPVIFEKDAVPVTWEQAALFRTANQGKSLRSERYPETNGKFPVGGSQNTPIVKRRSAPEP